MDEFKLSEILGLKQKSLAEIQAKYKELFGQEPPSSNKVFLWRKIAYRMQELEHGSLSGAANSRIQELIKQYDPVNNKALRPASEASSSVLTRKNSRDIRLPIPGTVITKEYKGQALEVKVLEKGFEYKNKVFRSLTAIAKEVTSAHWNGFLFFNL